MIRAVVLSLLCFLSLGACLGAEPHVLAGVSQAGDTFLVEAAIEAPVTVKTAWEVLTDFDHMAAILGNLTFSKAVSRDGNTLVVRQEGVARYGLLSFSFQSEREIRLDPMKRIVTKTLSGSVKRMESELRLGQADQGVRISYRAEVVPDSVLAHLFGAPFLRHEIEEQFRLMTAEMVRRERGGSLP